MKKEVNPEDYVNNKPGDRDYRSWIGPPEHYDVKSISQMVLAAFLGIRETHYFLDLGCGSLRLGKLLIPFLLSGRYHGIEPEEWLIQEGVSYDLGEEILQLKKPRFDHNKDFDLSVFGRQFDFIWAQSVLTHAAMWQIERCLAEAKVALVPGGLFVFNAHFDGGEDYTGAEWVYPACASYTRNTIGKVLDKYGWEYMFIVNPMRAVENRWIVASHDFEAIKSFAKLKWKS